MEYYFDKNGGKVRNQQYKTHCLSFIWSLAEDLVFGELYPSQAMFAVGGPVFKHEQLL